MKRIKLAAISGVFILAALAMAGSSWFGLAPALAADGKELTYLGHFRADITNEIIIGNNGRGIRHDVYYEGAFSGDLVSGFMKGIDNLTYRSDGIDEINTRALITTYDGAYISVDITGYVYPDGTIGDSYVKFESGHENYSWLNTAVFRAKATLLKTIGWK